MGVTYKEDCNDLRNSKVIDLIKHLHKISKKIDVFDPLVNKSTLFKKIGIKFYNKPNMKKRNYDILILSVPHRKIINMGINKIKIYLYRCTARTSNKK